mgnify:CR=1 FL=1
MIIDFIGEENNGTFTSTQHFCRVLQDCSYEFGIKSIILELKKNTNQNKTLWMLSTNLVDRCSTNPYRAVSYFTLEAYKERHFYDFPTVDYFPLERTNTRPRFGIRDIFGNKSIRILNIIVRAEIRPKCSDSANLSRC